MIRATLAGLALVLGSHAAVAQSVLERTPNFHGVWGLESGNAAFVFAHRFEFLNGGDELLNVPTLTLGVGLPLGLTAGLEYSSNSEIVSDALGENETEYWLKRSFGLGRTARVAAIAAYNGLARSIDGAASARADLGPVALLGELRGFSNMFDSGESGFAGAVGGAAELTPFLGVVGDVGRVLSSDTFSTVWSLGLAVAIPGSPHTLSLHGSNGGSTTLQSASREKVFGPESVRYGFAFTVPLGNGAQWARIFRPERPAPVAAGADSGDVRVDMRMIAYAPAEIRIRPGQRVEWINRDPVPHTVTADDRSWDSGVMNEGARYVRRFDHPGRYPYHCTPHPQMKGVVVVEGA